MSYRVKATKRYKKDYKRLLKSGAEIGKLEVAIDLLVSDRLLPERYRDHELKGVMAGTRECHIGPDWLLRYIKDNEILVLLLITTGDHRHVLGIE